jgi:hypothetical protein
VVVQGTSVGEWQFRGDVAGQRVDDPFVGYLLNGSALLQFQWLAVAFFFRDVLFIFGEESLLLLLVGQSGGYIMSVDDVYAHNGADVHSANPAQIIIRKHCEFFIVDSAILEFLLVELVLVLHLAEIVPTGCQFHLLNFHLLLLFAYAVRCLLEGAFELVHAFSDDHSDVFMDEKMQEIFVQ